MDEVKTLVEINGGGVSARFYYDYHGKNIPWELNGRKSFNRYFDNIKLILKTDSEGYGTYFVEGNGKRLNLGQITSCKLDGNLMRLKCCVGAG